MDTVTAIADRGAPGNGRPGANPKRGDGQRSGSAEPAAQGRHAIDAVDDVTMLLGMQDGALEAPVQAHIVALMEEIDRLRAELAQLRRQEGLLREQADHHPLLPIAHRRAFLRDLNRLRAQAERGETDQADTVGYLDGGDFAIALPLVGEPEAQSRAQRLAERMASMTFLWNGTRPLFTVSVGRAPFSAGDAAEAVLSAADAARRSAAAIRQS
jgi:GGDEF domain-containing protein